ncbi:MAG: glycosyltransferase family 2 protein [Candidatus Hodarchaeota archaeon]
MRSKAVDISVIMPCRNEEKYIQSAIERIVNQRGAGKAFSYELIIVDGRSDDSTVDIVKEESKKYSSIKLLINEKRITPSAFNLGIKNSTGKYVCLLGAHSNISDDYLTNCLETIKKVDADNVGGPWRAKGDGYIGEAIALVFQSPFCAGGAKSHNLDYEGYLDTVWGGFYNREVFDKIGFFDEELVRNQDDELNYRLVKAGGKIWQSPKIEYYYICRNSLKSLFQQYMQYGYWKVPVIRKHKKPASVRHIIPGLFVGSLACLAVISPFSQLSLKILVSLLVIYAAANLVAALLICRKLSRAKYIAIIPLVFFAHHFGYGYGFLRGFLDFVILKRNLGTTFTKITRSENSL